MTALESVSLAHSLQWHAAQGNIAYEMGAYGLPLRATVGGAFSCSFALVHCLLCFFID